MACDKYDWYEGEILVTTEGQYMGMVKCPGKPILVSPKYDKPIMAADWIMTQVPADRVDRLSFSWSVKLETPNE